VPSYPNRVVLQFETEDGTVSGCATTSNGTDHEFAGWLGLLGVLQLLIAEDEASPPTRTPNPRGDDLAPGAPPRR
jgi:hypothetical protein